MDYFNEPDAFTDVANAFVDKYTTNVMEMEAFVYKNDAISKNNLAKIYFFVERGRFHQRECFPENKRQFKPWNQQFRRGNDNSCFDIVNSLLPVFKIRTTQLLTKFRNFDFFSRKRRITSPARRIRQRVRRFRERIRVLRFRNQDFATSKEISK